MYDKLYDGYHMSLIWPLDYVFEDRKKTCFACARPSKIFFKLGLHEEESMVIAGLCEYHGAQPVLRPKSPRFP